MATRRPITAKKSTKNMVIIELSNFKILSTAKTFQHFAEINGSTILDKDILRSKKYSIAPLVTIF